MVCSGCGIIGADARPKWRGAAGAGEPAMALTADLSSRPVRLIVSYAAGGD
jgi:hypothetical protein